MPRTQTYESSSRGKTLEASAPPADKKKKKKDKEKPEKAKTKLKKQIKDAKEKKSSKKSSKSKDENLILDLSGPMESLAVSDSSVAVNGHAASTGNGVNGVTEDGGEDLDFWLATDGQGGESQAAQADQAPAEVVEAAGEAEEEDGGALEVEQEMGKTKKSKSKKEKKAKKEKPERSKKKSKRKDDDVEDSRNRNEYEETNGITNAQKEERLEPVLLVETPELRVEYCLCPLEGVLAGVGASLSLTNASQHALADLRLTLPDSDALKMVRTDPSTDVVSLPPIAAHAALSHRLSWEVQDDALPQRLRGTLSYKVLRPLMNLKSQNILVSHRLS